MYQAPPRPYTQIPAPAHQYPQSQPWHQPAIPQPPHHPAEFQHISGHSAPPLPPKPELYSFPTNSSGSWGGGETVTSPTLQAPSQYWSAHPPALGHQSFSSPMISSSEPRMGGAISPEQVQSLDRGRYPESGQAPQAAGSSHPQQMTSAHGQSPEIGPYALVPPTPPQMRGMTPMPQSPYLSPVPRTVEGTSPPQASMSPLFKPPAQPYFSSPSPMPPPPPINRPFTATPAPPNHPQPPSHPPPPPPLPTHHSEPQVGTTQSHTPAPPPHARHFSLPPFPPPPPTPAPGHPPLPSTPGIPPPSAMPVPSFPQPFGTHAPPIHGGTQGWVGGIAPRASMHFRPHYQPDWNNMPPIPQASPAPPIPPVRPPLTSAPPVPPPPAVASPSIQMPTPVVAAPAVPPPPPPLPPHPKHAATSPVVMTHGQWLGEPYGTGSAGPNAPPLPPKVPELPPNPYGSHSKDHSWPFQQEPALPPKEPPLPPKEPSFLEAPQPTDSPLRASPPAGAMYLEERHEAELREALRMSLAMSPQEEEEDAELARALRESMQVTSAQTTSLDSNSETNGTLNLGSGAWTPVLARTQSPGVESAYQTRPPPPLPTQSPVSVTPAQEIVPEVPPVTASPATAAPPRDDEPPPPTYEEVTGSQTATPSVVSPQPLPPVIPEPAQSAPILGSVSPRERNTRNNLQEIHSTANVNESAPEPPVAIEVIPPSAQNTIVRRERPARSSSEGIPPAHTSNEVSTSPPPRSSTRSPPHSTARPRASSQAPRPRPTTEPPRQPEPTTIGLARPRVLSASQANQSPVSRLSRASMFFGKSSSNLSLGSNDPPPRRTWAIDEEPSATGGLLLQAPEPALSILRSRNGSEANLQEGLADAPSTETLLDGVIYGFRDPDPPTPVPVPSADPPPPNISLDDSGAFHIQTLNFRHLLRLLSHYGSTTLMATPAAIAASKSGVHSVRVVLHFVRGPHERDPWFCRLFLELHTPPEHETPGPPDTTMPFPGTKILAPVGPRGKLYVVPGPLPQLPLSFQGLSVFLISRLDEARRASSDSSQRRLERILIECYGSVSGAAANNEEIGGRQKGSGNFRALGGIFSKVKDKLSSDKQNGNVNDHTYDLISPFHLEDYR